MRSIPSVDAQQSMKSSTKTLCSTNLTVLTAAVMRSIASRVIKAGHPDFAYQPLSPPEAIGDGCRIRWVSGSRGKPRAYAGTDFIIVRDGKIAAVYLFFDDLPH